MGEGRREEIRKEGMKEGRQAAVDPSSSLLKLNTFQKSLYITHYSNIGKSKL